MKFKEDVQAAIDQLIEALQVAPDAGKDEFYRISLEHRRNNQQPVGLSEWVIS